jgi:iron(III) transport system permease protein
MIERQQMTWASAGFGLVLLTLFIALIGVPLSQLFIELLPADGDGLDALRQLLLQSSLPQSSLRTAAVALLACVQASVLAVPLALIAVRGNVSLRLLVPLLGLLPLVMPPFITAAVLMHFVDVLQLAGLEIWPDEWPVSGRLAMLVQVYALHFFPVILFSLIVGLKRIDRALYESARNLGAGRLTAWRRIALPLAIPPYVLGAGLVSLRIVEDVATPLMLDIDSLLAPQFVLRLAAAGPGDPLLTLAALVMLTFSALFVALAWSALTPPPIQRAAGACPQPLRWRHPTGAALLATPLVSILAILALTPLLGLAWISLADHSPADPLPVLVEPFDHQALLVETLPILFATLTYAVITGILLLIVGGALGWLSSTPGVLGRLTRTTVNGLFAVPGLVLAFACLQTASQFDWAQAAWPNLAWLALAVVVAVKHLPFAGYLIARQRRMLGRGGQESARTLGVAGLALYLRVVLPARIGILGAVFLIGFTAAAWELTAVMVLLEGSSSPPLLTLSIFQTLQMPGGERTGATQAIVLVLALLALCAIIYRLLLHRHCRRFVPAAARRDAATEAL